jgi:hypothetical protein
MAEYTSDEERGDSFFDQCKAEARQKYAKLKLKGRIEKMNEFRIKKEEAEKALKEINAHYDVLRFELVPEQMEEDGTERITIAGIGRVSLTADIQVQVLKANQPALYDWFRSNKLGDLIVNTVNSSTLKAWVKRRIQAGELVPDVIKVTPMTRASITKA